MSAQIETVEPVVAGTDAKGADKAVERSSGTKRSANGKAPLTSNGIQFRRLFSVEGIHPYDRIEWSKREAVISNERGEVVFQQKDVEVPQSWTQMATNVVVSKYFRGAIGTPEREHSVRQLISRVSDTIAAWVGKMAIS